MEDVLADIQAILEGIFGREGASLLMDDLYLALDRNNESTEGIDLQGDDA